MEKVVWILNGVNLCLQIAIIVTLVVINRHMNDSKRRLAKLMQERRVNVVIPPVERAVGDRGREIVEPIARALERRRRL